MIGNIVAAVAVFLLGTNVAGYYSVSTPYLGVVFVAAGAWMIVGLALGLRLRLGWISFGWLFLLSLPLVLMMLSDRSFEKSEWLIQIFAVESLFLGVFVGGNKMLRWGGAIGTFGVVLVGAGLNFIEFFFLPNTWSLSPGRAAGWHVDPNITASVIVNNVIAYYFLRPQSLRRFDLFILSGVAGGVVLTFSRGGFVLMPLAGLAYLISVEGRIDFRRQTSRLLISAVVATAAIPWFVQQLDLTEDTFNRFAFIFGGGARDQSMELRQQVAEVAWFEFNRQPLTGAGVRAAASLDLAPHNMFATIAMDTGIFPLSLYVGLILLGLWRGLKDCVGEFAYERRILLPAMLATAAYSFASHTVLTYQPSVLVIALALGVASSARDDTMHRRFAGRASINVRQRQSVQ